MQNIQNLGIQDTGYQATKQRSLRNGKQMMWVLWFPQMTARSFWAVSVSLNWDGPEVRWTGWLVHLTKCLRVLQKSLDICRMFTWLLPEYKLHFLTWILTRTCMWQNIWSWRKNWYRAIRRNRHKTTVRDFNMHLNRKSRESAWRLEPYQPTWPTWHLRNPTSKTQIFKCSQNIYPDRPHSRP